MLKNVWLRSRSPPTRCLSHPFPTCDNQKCLQTLPSVPGKMISSLDENHWHRGYNQDDERSERDGGGASRRSAGQDTAGEVVIMHRRGDRVRG